MQNYLYLDSFFATPINAFMAVCVAVHQVDLVVVRAVQAPAEAEVLARDQVGPAAVLPKMQVLTGRDKRSVRRLGRFQ